jgi:glyoxylase-like metal-dependent hydrolase (beta-lactamase superfamily II)
MVAAYAAGRGAPQGAWLNALVPTAVPYVTRNPEITYGVAERLSPLVRRVTARNPSRFTAEGTGTYLVGAGAVAVVDPGPALDDHVAAILGALEAGERVTHLVITHTHADHSPAAAALREATGAPTYGYGPHADLPPEDADDTVTFGDPAVDDPDAGRPSEGADGSGAAEAAASGAPPKEAVDTGFRPDVVVRHGDVVSGDGWTLEAVHTPGHTSNHVCYGLVEEATLFTGDHVMGWSTSVITPPDGDLGDYLRSLQVLLDRPDARYLPTHSEPVEQPHELVRAYLAHRGERTEEVLAGLAAGDTTVADLVRRIYAAYPKALWKPAASSTYAHLLALLRDGRVAADAQRPDGLPRRTARFSLV